MEGQNDSHGATLNNEDLSFILDEKALETFNLDQFLGMDYMIECWLIVT